MANPFTPTYPTDDRKLLDQLQADLQTNFAEADISATNNKNFIISSGNENRDSISANVDEKAAAILAKLDNLEKSGDIKIVSRASSNRIGWTSLNNTFVLPISFTGHLILQGTANFGGVAGQAMGGGTSSKNCYGGDIAVKVKNTGNTSILNLSTRVETLAPPSPTTNYLSTVCYNPTTNCTYIIGNIGTSFPNTAGASVYKLNHNTLLWTALTSINNTITGVGVVGNLTESFGNNVITIAGSINGQNTSAAANWAKGISKLNSADVRTYLPTSLPFATYGNVAYLYKIDEFTALLTCSQYTTDNTNITSAVKCLKIVFNAGYTDCTITDITANYTAALASVGQCAYPVSAGLRFIVNNTQELLYTKATDTFTLETVTDKSPIAGQTLTTASGYAIPTNLPVYNFGGNKYVLAYFTNLGSQIALTFAQANADGTVPSASDGLVAIIKN